MPNNDRTRRGRHALILACAVFAGFFTLSPRARADQAGVPFWQSGSYASLAAAPASPGWSLTVAPDYYGVGPGAKPFKIGTTVVSGLKVDSAYVGLALGYAPKARFLGGQLDFTLGWGVGADTTAATVKLSNPPESFVGSQSVFGGFDLAQDRREIAGPERDALVREQDLQPLPRDRRRAARLEEPEQAHAALRPNRRVSSVFFSSATTIGKVSPAMRRAASL